MLMKSPLSFHLYVNPIAFRITKTPWSFYHSECDRVKRIRKIAKLSGEKVKK